MAVAIRCVVPPRCSPCMVWPRSYSSHPVLPGTTPKPITVTEVADLAVDQWALIAEVGDTITIGIRSPP